MNSIEKDTAALLDFAAFVKSKTPELQECMDLLYSEMDKESPDVDAVLAKFVPSIMEVAKYSVDHLSSIENSGFASSVIDSPESISEGPLKDAFLELKGIKQEMEAKGYAKYGYDPFSAFLTETGSNKKYLELLSSRIALEKMA